MTVAAVLLAGGQATRMGGIDKMLLHAGGQSLLHHVIRRIRPQVGPILLNANGDPRRFSATGLPVEADSVGGQPGPLAGILTGLEWLKRDHPDISWLVSVATDTPLLPSDFVDRLRQAQREQEADLACAVRGDIVHPVLGLWPVSLADPLRRALTGENLRKVGLLTARYRVAHARWPDNGPDPFLNVNTPEDLVRLELLMDGGVLPAPSHADTLTLSAVPDGQDGEIGPSLFLPPGKTVRISLEAAHVEEYRAAANGARPELVLVARPVGGRDQIVAAAITEAEADAYRHPGDRLLRIAMPAAVQHRVLQFTAPHPPAPKRRRRSGNPDDRTP